MTRDIWLDDDEPGCLECGALVFKASRVTGVCNDCLNEVSSMTSLGTDSSFGFISWSEDDIPWTEE